MKFGLRLLSDFIYRRHIANIVEGSTESHKKQEWRKIPAQNTYQII